MRMRGPTKTMTLNLSEAEMKCLEKICSEDGMSKIAVMRQALRLYQSMRHYMREQNVYDVADVKWPRLHDKFPMILPISTVAGGSDES